jgi:hypothetical protein
MSQFRIGDKAIRKAEHRDKNYWKFGGDAVSVFRVDGNSIDVGDGNGCFWDEKYFDLLPAEVTVSNEAQLPGIPDGYRAVRFGKAKDGDWYVGANGKLQQRNVDVQSAWNYLIVEKIEPPKPKTRLVVLNRYLVWDDGTPVHGRVVECEESYVTACWHNYKLIGHSETIEVEV